MNPELTAQLVGLGVKLAVTLIERHAGRRAGEMDDDEIRAAIAEIEIRPVDDLIEEGRERARQGRES